MVGVSEEAIRSCLRLLNFRKKIGFAEEMELCVVDLDLLATVFGQQHSVTSLDAQWDVLSILRTKKVRFTCVRIGLKHLHRTLAFNIKCLT